VESLFGPLDKTACNARRCLIRCVYLARADLALVEHIVLVLLGAQIPPLLFRALPIVHGFCIHIRFILH